jgi:hypothetical protein
MRNRPEAVTLCTGLVVIGLIGGIALQAQGQTPPAVQAPALVAPPDTAALRAQYEQWRTEFKTWGKWAPIGQESKGTTSLITPEKVASAMRLAKDGIVVSLAHAEPTVAAPDVAAAGLFRRTTVRIDEGGTADNYQVRRVSRAGRDSIDHAPGAHDDIANAVAGVSAMFARLSTYNMLAWFDDEPSDLLRQEQLMFNR